jgi:ribonuclease HI
MDLQGNNPFYRYADTAYTNSEDYHSTSGYVFIVNVGAITWGSHKQTIITLSSTEAEYIALSEAMRKAKWPAALYDELGYQANRPIKIFGDNNGSIAMATNSQFHKRSKHITIRYHWIRQQIQDGLLQIHPCRDPQQTADILTKALTPEKHNQHITGLGISMA